VDRWVDAQVDTPVDRLPDPPWIRRAGSIT